MRVEDFARAVRNLSVIDEHSYWIDAYLRKQTRANIHVGDLVEATLLRLPTPINGRIESITSGISRCNAASTHRLPTLNPTFTWVRLRNRNSGAYQIEQSLRRYRSLQE